MSPEHEPEKKPTIMLCVWQNRTQSDFQFLKGKNYEKGVDVLTTLPAGKKCNVKYFIPLWDPRDDYAWSNNERVGHVDINKAENDVPYLKLWMTYLPIKKVLQIKLWVTFSQSEHKDIVPAQEMKLESADSFILINGTIEGDQLEKSNAKMKVRLHKLSLTHAALKKISELITHKLITLEDVQSSIPYDLLELLEEYI